MNNVEQPIQQVFDAYKAADFAKDVDTFVALYHEDVCVFDMWGMWSYNGIEARCGSYSRTHGSMSSLIQSALARDCSLSWWTTSTATSRN